jgi:DNA-binding transcriptional ArsR family regulator
VEIARGFSISRPAISQHLRILKDAGLVINRHAGTQRIYQIDAAGIAALKTHFEALWSSVLDNFKAAVETSDRPRIATAAVEPGAKEKTNVKLARNRRTQRSR